MEKLTKKEKTIIAVVIIGGAAFMAPRPEADHKHVDPELPKVEATVIQKEKTTNEEVKEEKSMYKNVVYLKPYEAKRLIYTGNPIKEPVTIKAKPFASNKVETFNATRYEVSNYSGSIWVVHKHEFDILSTATDVVGIDSKGNKVQLYFRMHGGVMVAHE